MTDPNVDDPNQGGAGDNQPPVSPKKDESIAGGSPSSQELLQIRQELAQTRSELKGLQSRQDKSQNETQRFMEEVKGHVAKGKSIDEAEQLVLQSRKIEEKDKLLYQIADKLGIGNSPQNVTGNNSNAANEVEAVFAEYELDVNDPAAASLLHLQGVELVKAAGKLAVQKAKSKSTDPSEAPSIQGGPPAPRPGVEKLAEEYKKDMLSAPRGKSGDAQRKLIQEKARKAGVPVDSINVLA